MTKASNINAAPSANAKKSQLRAMKFFAFSDVKFEFVGSAIVLKIRGNVTEKPMVETAITIWHSPLETSRNEGTVHLDESGAISWSGGKLEF